MSKKIVKRTKIKMFNLLIVLLVAVGLFFSVRLIIDEPIHNIIITGNSYLDDDYIINLANIKNYPAFISINKKEMCKKINKSSYISSCTIKKKFAFVLEINIKENKPLFFENNQKKYVFDNMKSTKVDDISKSFRVPRLLNYVPDKKYEKFVSSMSKVNSGILSKIGDIEYKPNDYDKDRFLLYMDDGNLVYLTLTKFKTINHYNEVLSQLEGHKGILYLDSGNHFEIKE